MSTTIQQLPSYLETFLQLQKQSPVHHQDSWLKGVREAAFTSFYQLGFPTLRDENWRFTSIAPIANTDFQLAEAASGSVTEKDVAPYRLDGLAAQLVFVNGHYVPHLSRLPVARNRLHVSNLAGAIENERETVEPPPAR